MRILGIILFVVFGVALTDAQEISGFIYDESSKEPLISALVVSRDNPTVTDSYGWFSIEGTIGDTLSIQYLGYESKKVVVDKSPMEIYLSVADNILNEVVIIGDNKEHLRTSITTGLARLSIKDIKLQPMVLGEADPIKALHQLPGIKFGAEGTSGLYVRGGSSGQNLLLVDDIPMFNANHGFGFLSAIPTESVKSVDVYKSGFPSKYGNRLSSVIDVHTKNGNKSERKTTVGISTIAAKLAHEGPIIENKWSYSLTGRYSLSELFSDFSFYDYSVKTNFNLNSKNKMSFFTLLSLDKYAKKEDDENRMFTKSDVVKWKNNLYGLDWRHFFSDALTIYSKVYLSSYAFDSKITENTSQDEMSKINSTYSSSIRDIGIKTRMDYYMGKGSKLSLGIGYSGFNSAPEESRFSKVVDQDTILQYETKFLDQNSSLLYSHIDYQINGERLGINAGIRFNDYVNGDHTINLEPRLVVNYNFPNKHIVKASYTRTNQYNHYLTSETINSPTDSWINSNNTIKPAVSSQYSLGFYPYLNHKKWHYETELYYKSIKNELMVNSIQNALIETFYDKIAVTDGRSYGWENMVSYTDDVFDVSLNYTLSNSERKLQDDPDGKNQYFPFQYDRRHDIGLQFSYILQGSSDEHKRVSHRFTADFVYASGAHYTLSDIIVYNPTLITDPTHPSALNRVLTKYPTGINNVQAPAFHRLNIAYNRKVDRKRYQTSLSAGIYNVYNRKNVFILNSEYGFQASDQNSEYIDRTLSVKRNSLIPILPFISYEITF